MAKSKKQKNQKPLGAFQPGQGEDKPRTSRGEGDVMSLVQIYDTDGTPLHIGSGVTRTTPPNNSVLTEAALQGEQTLEEFQEGFRGEGDKVEMTDVGVATGEDYEKVRKNS